MNFMKNVNIALSNEEMTNIKVVDLEKLYNFVVEHFLIYSHLGPQNVLYNCYLPSVKQKNSRQIGSLPTVKKHSANRLFVKCQKINTRQIACLPSVFFTLDKEPVCRVFFFHSAKSFFAESPKNCTQQRS
jgi:hypothetical protein